jgi:ABC-type lipoprotein release transport system permease subunit
MLSRTLILVRIAFANLFSSFLNVFVGAVLFLGAMLLVVGGAVFGTLDRSLSKSVVGSITGHLQIYSARSKDKLEVYGRFDGSDANLAPMENFHQVKARLMKLPNVQSVVPMGTSGGIITSGNTVDLALEKLRNLYRAQKEDPKGALPAEQFQRQAESGKGHVKKMVELLAKDMEKVTELGTEASFEPEERAALATASSPEFWNSFDDDPYGHLEVLENKIAPLVADADLLFVRYLGTDLDAYQATFDRLQITEGQKVPTGRRGILLPRFFYEEYMKLKNARRLDKMREAREAGRKLSDPTDKELQRFLRENVSQTREIVLQLDGIQTEAAVAKLQKVLQVNDTELAGLLSAFFKVTDENFDQRYKFFYDELAPMLALYRVRVGDTMTLRSFGRSGSLEAATVKLYGIFEFKGLEKSPLAGALALVDLITFRELYGFLTSDKAAELEAMKKATQAKAIDRQRAEEDLFGGDAALAVTEATETRLEEAAPAAKRRESARERDERVYSKEEVESGVVMHAAIVLKDGSPEAQEKTMAEIEALLAADKKPPDSGAIAQVEQLQQAKKLPMMVGAAIGPVLEKEKARTVGAPGPTGEQLIGLQSALQMERANLDTAVYEAVNGFVKSARPDIWVVSWSSAAGSLGQFIDVFRGSLGGMVVAFALVALLVVTLGVTIATLQRTSTIGTLRAIGAQREFVVSMVFIETLVLALVFATLGAAAGSGIVLWLHATGIPAFRDELYFFFSGPSLRPELELSGLAFAIGITQVVSLIAVAVPVIFAIRVPPLTAMQSTE